MELKALFEAPIPLPSWLTEEDINYYAGKFNQKGFTGGLNYYRALDLCDFHYFQIQKFCPIDFSQVLMIIIYDVVFLVVQRLGSHSGMDRVTSKCTS